MSSFDDDSEKDSSDEDLISARKRPSKSKRKSRSHKRDDERKRSNRHDDDKDGCIASRSKTRGKSTGRPQPARGRSETPRERHQSRPYHNFEGRQEQNQRRLSGRRGGYEGREENPDEYGHQSSGGPQHFWGPGPGTGVGGEHRARMKSLTERANEIRRAIPSTRCFDDGMLHCAADNMSPTGQSVHGRSLGRYGRSAVIFSRPDAPIVTQVWFPVSSDLYSEASRLRHDLSYLNLRTNAIQTCPPSHFPVLIASFHQQPGPLGINVTSSARGPLVVNVNGHAKIRGIQEGDVLTEIDGRDITGMSAPEVIALFRATGAKNRVVTIRRVRRSGIMYGWSRYFYGAGVEGKRYGCEWFTAMGRDIKNLQFITK